MDPLIVPVRLFFSYASKDKLLRQRVVDALQSLESDRRIAIWGDWLIPSGERYYERISKELESAEFVLLLLSEHYLESSACAAEARRAMNLERLGVSTVPIIMNDCNWRGAFARPLQAIIPSGPLTAKADSDSVLGEIVASITQMVVDRRSNRRSDEFALLTDGDLEEIRSRIGISIAAIERATAIYPIRPTQQLLELSELKSRLKKIEAEIAARTGRF